MVNPDPRNLSLASIFTGGPSSRTDPSDTMPPVPGTVNTGVSPTLPRPRDRCK